jgi:uncharacterized protein YbjT (DUF2867 family)
MTTASLSTPTGAISASDTGLDVVTGAFSYSGRAIAAALSDAGRRVRTLTGHPGRAPEGSPLEVRPLDFVDQLGLVESLSGVTTLYNTYWVRFAHGRVDHQLAVANSRVLFQAAKRAEVQRIVHVSITHPSASSPLPYFSGKAAVERALAEAGVPYAVLRPAVLLEATASSSTTSPGCYATFPSLRWAGEGTAGSGGSTSTIWPNSAWPKGGSATTA